jgi:hypothetical protein
MEQIAIELVNSTREPLLMGKAEYSTVDLLVLTSFVLEILITFHKTSYFNEEVNGMVLSLPLLLVFPDSKQRSLHAM